LVHAIASMADQPSGGPGRNQTKAVRERKSSKDAKLKELPVNTMPAISERLASTHACNAERPHPSFGYPAPMHLADASGVLVHRNNCWFPRSPG
jgi:hypothetical protein